MRVDTDRLIVILADSKLCDYVKPSELRTIAVKIEDALRDLDFKEGHRRAAIHAALVSKLQWLSNNAAWDWVDILDDYF